jgi:hypothetical protein
MFPSGESLFLNIAASLSLSLQVSCSYQPKWLRQIYMQGPVIENHNNKEACVLDSVLYEFRKLI